MKNVLMSFFSIFLIFFLVGCEDDEDEILNNKEKVEKKYEIKCYQAYNQNKDVFFVNDYEFNGHTIKIKDLQHKTKGNIEQEYLNSMCVITPNLNLLNLFSTEEQNEFKKLQEKTGFIYEIRCRNLANSGSSGFKANSYVSNQNEIGFAEKDEKGKVKVYKIIHPTCSILKRKDLWG